MRGTNIIEWVPGERVEGSSPHARDKLQNGSMSGMENRIIPACAGQMTNDELVQKPL